MVVGAEPESPLLPHQMTKDKNNTRAAYKTNERRSIRLSERAEWVICQPGSRDSETGFPLVPRFFG
jgi:hypothetical protein